ncbi:hypothetical protein H6A32_15025 [Drancourtella massiliensis]|uniref:O-antigen ligase domain-containing protein n=2 Tax=Drancourtella massiliensis TaxID=1632013 RepID=A0ABS2ELR0_9FIRM|nr:hypothetical protein [Drancourtella massiliensis]
MKIHIKIDTLKCIGISMLLFMFLYEITLKGSPSILSSRKVAFAIIICCFLLYNKSLVKNYSISSAYWGIFLITIAVIIHELILLMVFSIQSEYMILPRLIYFLLYSVFASFLWGNFYKSTDQLMISFVFVGIIQSFIVYGQLLSGAFRNFLNNYFQQVGNVEFLREQRATGLGAEAAALSITLFISLIACSYFILCYNNYKYIVAYVFILSATLSVARTGFYCGVLLGIYNLFRIIMKKGSFLQVIKTLFYLALILAVLIFFVGKYGDIERIQWILNWATKIFSQGSQEDSISRFMNMEVPPLDVSTYWGTGVFRGIGWNGINFQNDGGYFQNYFAMGLIWSILFYGILFVIILKTIFKIKNIEVKLLMLIFAAVLMVVEIKEPFVLKYVSVFSIMLMLNVILKKKEG